MSTRSQTLVEGNEEVKVYKHSDGYPSGVLPFLKDLLPSFAKNRGFDPQYLTAWVSQTYMQGSIKQDKEYQRRYKKQAKAGDSFAKGMVKDTGLSYTGHGVDAFFHGDIEYLYYIRKDFSVDILEPGNGFWDIENPTLNNFRLVRKVTLEELVKAKFKPYCNLDLATLKEVKEKE